MKAFVINLDRSIDNYNKQKPHLEKIGLEVDRFKAIDAGKDEHLKYTNSNINKIIPKSVMGSSLSHILVSKYILNQVNKGVYTDKYYLILEDDCYPFDKKKDIFNKKIDILINDIENIDKNWDIILLHSDGIDNCKGKECNNYNINFYTGSAACYLISINGLKKLSQEKNIFFYIDIYTSMNKKYRKYKVKKNLFYTDESLSLARSINNNFSLRIKENIFNILFYLRGEKKWCMILNYNILRINNTNITLNNLIDFILFIFLLVIIIIIIKKKNFKLKMFFNCK
jgi:GR25 family glycosyltransferase involved in LPS biosynthesis